MHGWNSSWFEAVGRVGESSGTMYSLYHLAQTVNHPFLKSGSLAAALSRRNEGECTRSWASARNMFEEAKGHHSSSSLQ